MKFYVSRFYGFDWWAWLWVGNRGILRDIGKGLV